MQDATAVCGDGLVALATAIANLDLVITVDTLAAHLAGALRKPAWVLLQHAADWRWMTDRNDSPWYPGMRLFRQSAAGNWRDVIGDVRDAMECGTCERIA
jgi:ADP-heptose:LPS heptosyltransferase